MLVILSEGHVILSEAKNLSWASRQILRFAQNDMTDQRSFAEFTLERSEGLRMTGRIRRISIE